VQLGLGLTIGLIALVLVGFVAVQRYGLLSKVLGWLSDRNIGRAKFERWRQHLIPLEASLTAYYIAHPWRFGASLGLHFGAFAFSNIQNFLSLRLLLGANAPGLAEAIMVTIHRRRAGSGVSSSRGDLAPLRASVLPSCPPSVWPRSLGWHLG
jgi:hypothetical protein